MVRMLFVQNGQLILYVPSGLNSAETSLFCSVCKINVSLQVTHRCKMTFNKWQRTWLHFFADTLVVQKFNEIILSHTIYGTNAKPLY